jgi:predicted nucleic acid-binding protein
MDAVLLDTTVASLLHPKKKGSTLRLHYEPHLQGKTLVLSFQSVAELLAWGVENRWGQRQRRKLESFMRKFLVVPYDFELAKIWAEVSTHCKRQGRRLEAGDAWIVATAVHRSLPLVTHDAEYLGLGISDLRVISYAGKSE